MKFLVWPFVFFELLCIKVDNKGIITYFTFLNELQNFITYFYLLTILKGGAEKRHFSVSLQSNSMLVSKQ